MIMMIVGEKGFRKGIDLYFKRHDGTAATVEDFVAAMADANKADLSQFMLWYSQAGTPELTCRLTYSEETKTAKLTVRQEQRPTPGQTKKKPLHVPLKIGLLDAKGNDISLKLEDATKVKDGVLHLRRKSETFTFTGISSRPVVSLLREFSAPVNLTSDLTDADLEFLIAHDSDQFNRWQSAQLLGMRTLTAAIRSGKMPAGADRFARALGALVTDETLEPAFRALALSLPTFRDVVLTLGDNIDPEAIYETRKQLRASIGAALKPELEAIYHAHAVKGAYKPDAEPVGKRSLRNSALSYLTMAGGRNAVSRLREHYKTPPT